MSQLEDLNRAMAYIEEHLDGTVDMDVLARIAVCSKYQLQRMFPYLTGVTLPEYIRRRAMTRAAQDLRATDAKVGIPSDNGTWEVEDAGEKAVDYWEKLGPRVHEILDLVDGSEPAGLLGVQFCRDGAFDCYMACVATNRPCPEGMEERTVEAATYAVFECVGPMPEAMTNLWHRILTEWLPSSGYRWESKTDVERYFTPRMTASDSRSEVWLPVVKA